MVVPRHQRKKRRLCTAHHTVKVGLRGVKQDRQVNTAPRFTGADRLRHVLSMRLRLIMLMRTRTVRPQFRPDREKRATANRIRVMATNQRHQPVPSSRTQCHRAGLTGGLARYLRTVTGTFRPQANSRGAVQQSLGRVQPIVRQEANPRDRLPLDFSKNRLPITSTCTLGIINGLAHGRNLHVVHTSLLRGHSQRQRQTYSRRQLSVHQLQCSVPFRY